MQLEGSCHCRAVRFRLESRHAVPYMRCYCSICRKTNGAGGYGINLGGDAATLEVEGAENVTVYRARIADADGGIRESRCERRFCSLCGSGLWLFTPDWPDLVHPLASAIDTPLEPPPERVHIMLGSKAGWTAVEAGPNDKRFDAYPDESLADWHKRLGLES